MNQQSGYQFGNQSGFGAFVSEFGLNEKSNPANDIIMELGRQNINRFVSSGEQAFTRKYLPFINELKTYFQVDHNYVYYKLLLLACPLLSSKLMVRFSQNAAAPYSPQQPASIPATPLSNAHSLYKETGLSQRTSSASPGGFSGYSLGPEPAARVPVGSPTPSPTQPPAFHASQGHVHQPKADLMALDLYIPLMALLTYVTLSGFIRGLTQDQLTADDLLHTLWFVISLLGLEVLVVVIVSRFLLMLPRPPSILDVLALSGTKHAIVCALLLFRELVLNMIFSTTDSDTNFMIYMLFVTYGAIATMYYYYITIQSLTSSGESTPAFARPFKYGWCVVQFIIVYWFAMRPV